MICFINEGVRSALLHPGAVCSNGFLGMEHSYRSHREGCQGSHFTGIAGTPLTKPIICKGASHCDSRNHTVENCHTCAEVHNVEF